MAEALLISRKDVVKFTAMNGNVDTDKFIQYVKIAQDKHIENYLGTDLLNKIQADIIANTLTGDYLTLVNDYVKPALLHFTMVEFLPYSNYTIANKGVFKHTSENADGVTKEEIDYLLEKERDTAEYYINRLVEYLTYQAPSKFTEYYTNVNEDIYPDKGGTSFEGWVI